MNDVRQYEVSIECPQCRNAISWSCKTSKVHLQEADLWPELATLELWCQTPKCQWRGRAGGLKILGIVAVDWIG
jgi:hypothetical protein